MKILPSGNGLHARTLEAAYKSGGKTAKQESPPNPNILNSHEKHFDSVF
jgi:hypothetical protein